MAYWLGRAMIRNAILLFAVSLPGLGLIAIAASSSNLFDPGGLLERWQTLVAGLLAIAAAFVGGTYIEKEISAARELEANRNRRKFAAVRATLPLTLSAVTEYSRRSASALRSIHAHARGNAIPHGTPLPDFPDLPIAAVSEIKETIEYADEDLYGALADLLGELQVHQSRTSHLQRNLRERANHVVMAANIEDDIIDAAEIFARAAALFDFARRENDGVSLEITAAAVVSALNQLDCRDHAFPQVHQTVARRYERRAREA